jgi:hypothetical protein
MDEIKELLQKYDSEYVRAHLRTTGDINAFALTFFRDTAEIYDCITRTKNTERNPTGYSLNDAPILGLLVRVWKLLKEIIKYYEADNAEIISVLERPLIEAAVTAQYLLANDDAVVEDYRKCSYKDRLRLLRHLQEGSPFFDTKAGKRLLASVQRKMAFENLTSADFETQKRNGWRLQGKTFFHIFSEVIGKEWGAALYPSTYGMMSESIHGSWNESMDYCLTQNGDGTFSTYPLYQPADIRFVTPTIRFCNPAYVLWLQRIGADEDSYLFEALKWVDRVNTAIFRRFDEQYDG